MKKTQKKTPLFVQILVIAVIFAVGFALLAQSLKKEKNSLGVVIEDSTYPLVTIHYICLLYTSPGCLCCWHTLWA